MVNKFDGFPELTLTMDFRVSNKNLANKRGEEIVVENKIDYALLSLLVKWKLISICNLPVWSIMFIVE